MFVQLDLPLTARAPEQSAASDLPAAYASNSAVVLVFQTDEWGNRVLVDRHFDDSAKDLLIGRERSA